MPSSKRVGVAKSSTRYINLCAVIVGLIKISRQERGATGVGSRGARLPVGESYAAVGGVELPEVDHEADHEVDHEADPEADAGAVRGPTTTSSEARGS